MPFKVQRHNKLETTQLKCGSVLQFQSRMVCVWGFCSCHALPRFVNHSPCKAIVACNSMRWHHHPPPCACICLTSVAHTCHAVALPHRSHSETGHSVSLYVPLRLGDAGDVDAEISRISSRPQKRMPPMTTMQSFVRLGNSVLQHYHCCGSPRTLARLGHNVWRPGCDVLEHVS